MRTSGQIEIRTTAMEPIHHGGGTLGNTQTLRMQEFVDDDGVLRRVPFLSGNSTKHQIRFYAAKYALDLMGVDAEAGDELTKAEVDFLLSGGRLDKSGTAVDLARSRNLERLFPSASLCGYSAGNSMTESKIACSHLHVVCAENSWRMPVDMRESPHAALRAAALRGKEFGTRHDAELRNLSGRLLSASEAAERAKKKSARLAKSAASKTKDSADKGDSAQMIYDFQVIKPGTKFWGTIWFTDVTELELAALASAFSAASVGAHDGHSLMHLGAKRAVGFGLMKLELRGAIRAQAAEYQQAALVAADGAAGDRTAQYREHLLDNRAEILDAIREAAA